MERYTFSTYSQGIELLESIKERYLNNKLLSFHRDYVSLRESEVYTLYIYSGGYIAGATRLGYFENSNFIPA